MLTILTVGEPHRTKTQYCRCHLLQRSVLTDSHQEALKQRQATEQQTVDSVDEFKSETGVLKFFSKLAQAFTDSNNSDVSTPPHFSGKDDEWETWYSQFRTYLKGKG